MVEARLIPMYIDRRLRECDYSKLSQANKDVVDSQKHDRIKLSFPKGESYQECLDRMNSSLDLLQRILTVKRCLSLGRGQHCTDLSTGLTIHQFTPALRIHRFKAQLAPTVRSREV